MANLFSNADFSDGLTGWTHSDGVEALTVVIDDNPEIPVEERATAPGARIPGAGYLGQRFGEGEVTGNNLYFYLSPLDSTGYRLQIRLDYTDGTHETHDTHAHVDFEPPIFKQERVPLDRSKTLRQFGMTNMDLHEGAAIFVTGLYVECTLPTDEGDSGDDGADPFFGRRMGMMSARKMDARFFDLERKLDEILGRLSGETSPKEKEKA